MVRNIGNLCFVVTIIMVATEAHASICHPHCFKSRAPLNWSSTGACKVGSAATGSPSSASDGGSCFDYFDELNSETEQDTGLLTLGSDAVDLTALEWPKSELEP